MCVCCVAAVKGRARLCEEGNPAGLSSCSGGLRPLVELCVEPAGWEAQSSPRVARESWGLRSSHRRAEESCRDQEGRRGSEEAVPGPSARGSPIFPSGCEGKLGVALESPQGRRVVKGKGLLLSKVPRDTAMRPLSITFSSHLSRAGNADVWECLTFFCWPQLGSATSGQKPGKLPISSDAQDSPHNKE